MSLEQVIQENTNAVRELIAVMKEKADRFEKDSEIFRADSELFRQSIAAYTNAKAATEVVVNLNGGPAAPTTADTDKLVQAVSQVPTSATPEAAPSVAPTPSTAVAEAVAAPESKPAPSTTTTQEPVKVERTYTRDEFVRVVKEYAGSEADKSKIANLLVIAGTQNFRDVPEDKFAAVINAIPAAVVESVLKGA